MRNTQHLAVFYVTFGPEVRAFLHCGLLEELGQKFRASVITERPEARASRATTANLIKPPLRSEARKWNLRYGGYDFGCLGNRWRFCGAEG
jgi:hypothetical protein